jgi:iron-sulfur cluster repair protein YtfE (RIC family)
MAQQDACALLDSDHQKVERLFGEYESAREPDRKSQLAQTICMELTVHATIEEEIFYPALRQATGANDMVDEAEEEHQDAKDLITEIEDSDNIEPLMAELKKAIQHHVREERQEMFTKARNAAGLDLMGLASQLESRKAELMANYQPV